MSIKKSLLVVLVAGIAVLAVGAGPRAAGTAQAQPVAAESEPRGEAISYTGRLASAAGQPVAEGAYDFRFVLYESEIGGEPLWSEVQEGVPVTDGVFVAPLGSVNPIPASTLRRYGLWLSVEVRGSGEIDFTPLTPRQQLSAAAPAAPASPAANGACPHDHFGESWAGEGVGLTVASSNTTSFYVPSAGGVGIHMRSAGLDGIWVESAGWSGIYVQSSGYDAIRVQTAGQDGLHIFSTVGRDAIRVGDDSDPKFRVLPSGEVKSDVGYNTPAADLAEMMAVAGRASDYEPGDVLVVSERQDRAVALAATPYSRAVIGVYSTEPGFVGGYSTSDSASESDVPVAIVGIVPCKVSVENGAIRRGDLLVTSATPGHAMRADDPPPGTILGKALEPLAAGTGVVLVLVTLQ